MTPRRERAGYPTPVVRIGVRRGALVIVALCTSLLGFTPVAFADAGDSVSVNFAAAAPATYPHATGGGAWDDSTKNDDIVESLQASSFACGDVVTFLSKVTIDAATAASYGEMTLALDYSFTMDTTGQSGAAFSEFVGTRVNYPPIVDLLEPTDTIDQAIHDDGDSVATFTDSSTVGTVFTPGSLLLGTIQITNVSAGEALVLRTDVRLACKAGSRPTGNLQAQLTGGQITATNGGTPTAPGSNHVNTGVQTVPMKQFGDLSVPSISIMKTTNGADGLEIRTGAPITWTYVVTNTGTSSLSGVTVVDNQGVIVTCPKTTLAALESMTCTASGTAIAGNYSNTGTVTGSAGSSVVSASDTSTYFGFNPIIDIAKTPDLQSVIDGGTAEFRITVTNLGNVALSGVTVSDPLAPNCDRSIGSLAVAASVTYSCTLNPVNASITNVANASGSYGAVTVSDSDTAIVIDDVLPIVTAAKSVDQASVPETGANVAYTYTVSNTHSETFTVTSLIDDRLGNLNGAGTCTTGAVLAMGDSYTCVVSDVWASGETGSQFSNVFTAIGRDAQGNTDSDSATATVTFTDVLPDITIAKTVDTVTVPETGGTVTYTLHLTNSGPETITITALTDDMLTLPASCTSLIGQSLAPAASLDCTIPNVALAGEAGTTHVNTATVTGSDNEGNTATDSDTATVTFTDVLPDITIAKTANPTSVDFTGAFVTYSIRITNSGPETVTITAVTDAPVPISPACLALVGQVLAPSASLTCSIPDVWTAGAAATSVTDTATVTAEDNEHNVVTESDTVTVAFWWHGRTPGYWKNHLSAWVTYTPTTTIVSVFAIPSALRNGSGVLDLVKPAGQDTLMDALNYKGGSTLSGKAQILLRAAAAALLNVAYYQTEFPEYVTVPQLVTYVNAALAATDPTIYVSVANALDRWNNGNEAPLM